MAKPKGSEPDDRAWEQIQRELYSHVRRKARGRQEIDDLVQQVEITLVRKFREEPGLFERLKKKQVERAKYLATVVRNVLLNEVRSERRYRGRVKAIAPDDVISIAPPAEQESLDLRSARGFMKHLRESTDDSNRALRAAISILTDEHTISSYARRMKLPISTARRLFLDGVRELANAFRDYQHRMPKSK